MSFTVSKKLIEVSVDYIELGELVQVVNNSNKDLFTDGSVKTARAQFRYPSYGAHAAYTKDCFKESTISGQEGLYIDTNRMRLNKLKALLVSLKDGDGNEVDINDQFFFDIDPDFATALVVNLDDKILKEKVDLIMKAGALKEEDKEEVSKLLSSNDVEEEEEENKDKESK